MNDIYKVPPADSVQVAEVELAIEKSWNGLSPEAQKVSTLLPEIQSLIERIKLDEQKIKKLEKMNGITWLGDEQKGEKGEMNFGLTAADLYKDRSIWDIPINVADGGIREQAFWQGRECGARELEERIFWKKHGN